MSRVVGVLTERISPILDDLGYELVNVEYKKEGKNWFLRIFIDKEGGINLDDCQLVSRKLDGLLDEWDVIPYAYFLEVSSPGLERPLKTPSHYQRFAGNKAKLKTFEAIEGRKTFTGTIVGIENQIVTLEVDSAALHIPFDKISSAHLVF